MRVLWASLIVVIVDQITKLWVKGFSLPFLNFNHDGMYLGESRSISGNWFNITFVENPGIAFGIDFGSDYKILVSVFTIAATAGLFLYLYFMRDKNFSMRLSVAFIFGGALGNLIDRAFYGLFYGYGPFLHGKVVDFVDIRIFNLFLFNKTVGNYVFNIADLAVTAGVILLLFSYSREKEASMLPASVTAPESENILADNKE